MTTGTSKVAVEKWIDKKYTNKADEYVVELHHIDVNDQSSLIESWSLASRTRDEIVCDIFATAQHWTDQIRSGQQRFAVVIRDIKETIIRRNIIRVDTTIAGGTSFSSEPATMAGITKQLMRHNEALMKGTAQGYAHIVEHLTKQLDVAYARIEQLEKNHLKVTQLSEEISSAQTERDLLIEKQRADHERKKSIVAKLSLLIPVIIAKMSGKPLQSTIDPTIQEFARSIDSDQLAKLTSILKPEQQLALATVLEMVAQDEETETQSVTNGTKYNHN